MNRKEKRARDKRKFLDIKAWHEGPYVAELTAAAWPAALQRPSAVVKINTI